MQELGTYVQEKEEEIISQRNNLVAQKNKKLEKSAWLKEIHDLYLKKVK